jgi:hypothetical protein
MTYPISAEANIEKTRICGPCIIEIKTASRLPSFGEQISFSSLSRTFLVCDATCVSATRKNGQLRQGAGLKSVQQRLELDAQSRIKPATERIINIRLCLGACNRGRKRWVRQIGGLFVKNIVDAHI